MPALFDFLKPPQCMGSKEVTLEFLGQFFFLVVTITKTHYA